MNVFKHVPTYLRRETRRTNKLKLMFLSTILLAAQLKESNLFYLQPFSIFYKIIFFSKKLAFFNIFHKVFIKITFFNIFTQKIPIPC